MAIQAGDIVYNITGDNKGLSKQLAASEAMGAKSFEKFSANAKKLGLAMTGIGAGITGVMGVAVKSAATFGGAMAEVSTLGVKDMEGMSDAVKDVATEFGMGLTDSAKAAYQAISAGASEVEAPQLLAEAAKAATAGVSDMTTAIELGTSVTNAYGREMENVSGVYDAAFVAVKSGVTTFEELSGSVGKLSPTFVAAGLSMEEMFSSIAALTKGGIATAESVTYLNATVSAFQRQGQTAILESKGLAGALEWLKEETGGNQKEMLEFLGSTEAMKAVLALTGSQAEDFSAIMEEMGNKAGMTQEAFNKIAENDPAFAWRLLKAEMSVLAVEVGEALLPALKSLVETIKPIVSGVVDWVKAHPELTAALVTLTAGVGALMLVLGPLLMVLPGLVTLFGAGGLAGAATGAAGAVGTAGLAGGFTALVGVLAPIVAGGGLLAVLGTELGMIHKAVKSHVEALEQQKKKEEDVIKTTDKYIESLREKGAVILDSTMKGMDHAQKMKYLAQQEKSEADGLARAWFETYAGRTETEKEFARMKNLMLNQEIDAQKAAMAVVSGLSKEQLTKLMKTEEDATDALLEEYGVRVDSAINSEEIITDAVYEAAAKRQAAFDQANVEIIKGNRDAAQASAAAWSDFWEMFDAFDGIQNTTAPPMPPTVPSFLGNVFNHGALQRFANGGVVDQLSFFQHAGGLGSMAEMGPEAIMPLQRDSQGRLGVIASGGAGANININLGGVVIQEDMDIDRVVAHMGEELDNVMSRRGLYNA